MSWKNPLKKKGSFDLPVVEQSPFVWDGRIMLAEIWDEAWESNPWDDSVPRHERQYVRIRDEQSGEVVSRFMRGYGYCSAFKWEGKVYVFAGKMSSDSVKVSENVICMSYSEDLLHWSQPQEVIKEPQPERLFNTSVCYDGRRFVMSYESDCDVWFTLKFAESDDLLNWRKIDNAILGPDRYTACPAIRYVGGYFYVLYLDYDREHWWFETKVARSRDLANWEKSPHSVIVPDTSIKVLPGCPEHAEKEFCTANGRECNTSDPDLIEWQGKTRVYFTGGCQHWGGALQYAEFDGGMQEFFEAYF